MTERLLQFIWQFQYYNSATLATTAGEDLQIISPGELNREQGPDFKNARIRIALTTWAGAIELHLKTSDWSKHKHQEDPNYQNVILHVVLEHDSAINDIPVLELKSRISTILLQRYQGLMDSRSFIPCGQLIASVPDITWKSWKERLLVERLIRKSAQFENSLKQNNYHWEETFWWQLARSFGMKTNADAFEEIARSIPLPVLAKHKNQVQQLEAILLGQAGLLKRNPVNLLEKDDYLMMLQKEFKFLQKKYKLRPVHARVQYLRMRPGNFPGLRLAQLAMLIQHSAHLFSRIREAGSAQETKNWFNVTANDYWHYHYQPGIASSFREKHTGADFIDNIIINTICPVLFAYGNYYGEQKYKHKALDWLEELRPENNQITRGFIELGLETRSAYDSQALIELKNEYCSRKRCLECGVGNAILKGQHQPPQSTFTSISG